MSRFEEGSEEVRMGGKESGGDEVVAKVGKS